MNVFVKHRMSRMFQRSKKTAHTLAPAAKPKAAPAAPEAPAARPAPASPKPALRGAIPKLTPKPHGK